MIGMVVAVGNLAVDIDGNLLDLKQI